MDQHQAITANRIAVVRKPDVIGHPAPSRWHPGDAVAFTVQMEGGVA